MGRISLPLKVKSVMKASAFIVQYHFLWEVVSAVIVNRHMVGLLIDQTNNRALHPCSLSENALLNMADCKGKQRTNTPAINPGGLEWRSVEFGSASQTEPYSKELQSHCG